MWLDGSGLPRFRPSSRPSMDSGSTGPVAALRRARDTISWTVRFDFAHFWSQNMSAKDTGSPRSIRAQRNSTLRRVSVESMATTLLGRIRRSGGGPGRLWGCRRPPSLPVQYPAPAALGCTTTSGSGRYHPAPLSGPRWPSRCLRHG